MLDVAALRVAFGVVALTLVLLFTVVGQRGARAAYSRWWRLALILFLSGSASYLFNGTSQQVWANPLGNALLVCGAGLVWAGARSLRASRPAVWPLVCGPVLSFAVATLDHPATNTWSGGAVFLGLMSVMVGLASYELSALPRSYSRVRRPLFFASATFSVYYFLRLVAFLAEGQNGTTFRTYFGSAATTLVTMVLLVVVSFSMAALSNEQRGGEEFILLLPGAAPERAEEVTIEISRRLATAHADDPGLEPTASYGIATFGHGVSNLESVIASADSALYRAKALGRNRAVHGLPQWT